MSSPKWRLTIYEEDDSTVWTDCTTDPNGSRPYLKPISGGVSSEIDLIEGSATIGQINLQVLDKRTNSADQDTGWFTAKLATGGDSALIGRRALLERDLGSGYATIFDGVIDEVDLNEAIVTYDLVLKDIRERERKIRLFTKANTASVMPKGLAAGYGQTPGTSNYLIPAVTPGRGTWYQHVPGYGAVQFDAPAPVIDLTNLLRDLGRAVLFYADNGSFLGHGYPDVIVRWRPAAGGSWSEFENMKSYGGKSLFLTSTNSYRESVIHGIWINDPDTPANLPTNGQSIDFQVLSNTEPTEQYPILVETTAGQLLKDIYDGTYCDEDPRIRYDSTRMATLIWDSPTIRIRITEVVDDLQEWVRKNIYQALGWAPALNADGEIYPVSWELPDVDENLTEFSNQVVKSDADWGHSGRDAITLVEVLYERDYIPESAEQRIPENLRTIEVKHAIRSSAASLLGDHPLKIEAEIFRAIGATDGDPISGDVRDEVGAKLAQLRARQAIDRFRYGGQRYTLRGRRSQIETVTPGQWGYVSASWLPEYSTGERGANRLVQVIGIQDLDPDWRELTLVDAGAHAQPIGQPTLGTLTVDSQGVVSIPVTAIPSNGEARIDYAINSTVPDSDSGFWIYVGRTDEIATLKTPPLPSGVKVWIRARGEAPGRRRSAWTTPTDITVPSIPVVSDCAITIDTAGTATVTWAKNAACQGVRIYRKTHLAAEDPGTISSYEDVDADDLTKDLSVTVEIGYAVSVEIEPWTQYPIAGTSGTRVYLTKIRLDPSLNPRPSTPSIEFVASFDDLEVID